MLKKFIGLWGFILNLFLSAYAQEVKVDAQSPPVEKQGAAQPEKAPSQTTQNKEVQTNPPALTPAEAEEANKKAEQEEAQKKELEFKAAKQEWIRATRQKDLEKIEQAEHNGVEVRLKDIARFRGVRANQLLGYGVVIGLEGTGDSKSTPFTATLLANAISNFGTTVDTTRFNPKNAAAVAIIAELPPFTSPGNTIDVTVQSIGDAKSLQGGVLLRSPLYAAQCSSKAMAVAQGPVSIGGFAAGSGGTSVQKNHVTVARIPNGGIVESTIPTQFLFNHNTIYLELHQGDISTAESIARTIESHFPAYTANAQDGGTIEVTIQNPRMAMQAMSEIEKLQVNVDLPAVVVINERTGTIAVGGNVRLGPAAIVHGSLRVQIDRDPLISQPLPESYGVTVVEEKKSVTVEEEQAQIGLLTPNTNVNDLAMILQTLKLSPRDIIAIMQALQQQGALKAKLKVI